MEFWFLNERFYTSVICTKEWKTSGIIKLDSVVCCVSLAHSKIPHEFVSLWMQRGIHGVLSSEQHL